MPFALLLIFCPHGLGDFAEYTSPHFFVDTDAQQEAAIALVRKLEHMQARIVKGIVGEDVEIPGRVRVVAFENPRDFTRFVGEEYVGGIYFRNWLHEPTIALPIGSHLARTTVAHELTHHVSRFVFPRQPLWFSEGLAEWAETIASDEDGSAKGGAHHAFGLAPQEVQRWLARSVVPAKDLFAWQRSVADEDGRWHASAWLFYHYLWNKKSKQLAAYTQKLSEGEDPQRAWQECFPEYRELKKLDDDVDVYRNGGKFLYFSIEAETRPRITKKAFTAADVHALQPRSTELARATQDDPLHPFVVRGASLEKIDEARKAKPKDWRLLLVRAWKSAALGDWEAAVSANPQNASTQNGLAWALHLAQRPREALPHANIALDLAPAEPAVIDTMAHVAADLGQCKQASLLFTRAREIALSSGATYEPSKSACE